MSVAVLDAEAAPRGRAKRAPIDPTKLSEGRKLLIFGIMAFGQFMALLDIQIVAASLNSIQAGLSAGPDEIAWVQTAYLMAEIVMIPLSGFLSQALSTRWLFTASAALFTLSSLLCGLAWDMPSMIAFRALQGFVGGAMVPTVFSTGFSMFTGARQARIPMVLGLVSTLAPTLGPTIGGWISEAASWRWLFFMNIAPGLLITLTLPFLGRVDEPNLSMLKKIDWLHLASLALFLGALQYVLEEGARRQWLEDERVAIAAWLSLIGFIVFLERSFKSSMPVVKLSPFRSGSFTFACTFNAVIGFGLYGATYLMPVFLGRVRGYNSFDIGTTVFVAGLFMAMGAPIAARLSNTVDPRIVITAGLSLFATGLWLLSGIGPEWGFADLLVPQAVRGFAILFCIVPSVGMALRGFAGPELRYASGLFNLMRNLGGAVGIAVVNTWLQDNGRWHGARLGEVLGALPDGARQAVGELAARMSQLTPDPARAELMARAGFASLVQRQALAQAFNDVFQVMSWLFLAALIMVPFCRPLPAPQDPAPAEAH